jgi:hypothetical protein
MNGREYLTMEAAQNRIRELEEEVDEAKRVSLKLRKNYACYLASMYNSFPTRIAEICDTELDPTGELLGYVREEAAALKALK